MKVLEKENLPGGSTSVRKYCLFDTAIGRMAIAWSKHGVLGLSLPECSVPDLRRRLETFRAQEAESDHRTEKLIERIQKHLATKSGKVREDYLDVELDYEGVTDFRRNVFEAARRILPGQTISYGELADHIGSRKKSRAVGQALAANRHAIIVPCHRIVGTGGALVGFSAAGGCDLKLQLLTIEGAL